MIILFLIKIDINIVIDGNKLVSVESGDLEYNRMDKLPENPLENIKRYHKIKIPEGIKIIGDRCIQALWYHIERNRNSRGS